MPQEKLHFVILASTEDDDADALSTHHLESPRALPFWWSMLFNNSSRCWWSIWILYSSEQWRHHISRIEEACQSELDGRSMVSSFLWFISHCLHLLRTFSYIFFFYFRNLKLKKGDMRPIKLYLYLDEAQPLNFSVSAHDLTAINSTLNDITLNFAKGTEAGKWFKFSWGSLVTGNVNLYLLYSKFTVVYVR